MAEDIITDFKTLRHVICKDIFECWLIVMNTYSKQISYFTKLIFLDMYNIIKWSNNMKTKVIFKRGMGLSWKPRCLYYSSYTCDLLVGMYERDVDTKTETGITLNKISNRPN